MIRIVIIADGERELDALPASMISRAAIIVLHDGRSWRVTKSPGGHVLRTNRYPSERAAIDEALS